VQHVSGSGTAESEQIGRQNGQVTRLADLAPGSGKRISAAKSLYLQMMAQIIAPQLADLGFAHRSGEFRHRSGEYLATVKPRGMNRNLPGEYMFDVAVGVSFVPAGPAWFWRSRLATLALRANTSSRREGGMWTVRAGLPVEPVAQDLLMMISSYGWPAIQVLLEDPGYPPDPARQWPRSFPPVKGRAAWAAVRRDQESAYSRVGPGNPGFDLMLSFLGSPEPGDRASVISELTSLAADDPRTPVGLLNRLVADPEPMVRAACVRGLARLPRSDAIRKAIQAAAADDENLTVRWAARYALRLAGG
jgi:hypothetical protein